MCFYFTGTEKGGRAVDKNCGGDLIFYCGMGSGREWRSRRDELMLINR
jgi:hypothetical protein